VNTFVRMCGYYNASVVVVFLTPGVLAALGVKLPHSPMWVWLPALLGLFAGIVLLLSASDLRRYGSFPYYNGIIRVVFVVAAFSMDFGGSAGQFMTLVAIGDIPLAVGCIVGIPWVTGRTPLQLLTNRGT